MQRGEHEVAGERGLDGDVRGLPVADLAHHDHVGVGPQHRAQPGVEGHARLGRDLHLLDPRDVLLDGVLDCENAALAVVDGTERGVQGRRLARPRGARHQHGAVGLVDRRADVLQRARGHAASVSIIPREIRSAPAQAIMAPLSVQSSAGGAMSEVSPMAATFSSARRIA